MYLLMAGKSPSHTNLIEDLGHDANDPLIVGGGVIRLKKNERDEWEMSLETGSHYDSVPLSVQSRFAEKVRRALSKQGLKITDVQNVTLNNIVENHHWDSYHQMA